jgi:hypothetical protein
MSYTIRYNRTTNHIEGLEVLTAGSETAWSQNACGSLTRGGLAVGKTYETVGQALKGARVSRKLCKNCEKAAGAALTATVPEAAPVATEAPVDRVYQPFQDRWGQWA